MKERLSVARTLPADAAEAVLVGRAYLPSVQGPALVAVRGAAGLRPVARRRRRAARCSSSSIRHVRSATQPALPSVGALADLLANTPHDTRDASKPWLLAPCDLQALKAAGVTFVSSMLERVIEEQARGDPAKAESVRRLDRRDHRRRPRVGSAGLDGSGAPQGRADRAGRVVAVSRGRHRTGRRDLHQVAADVGGRHRRATSASIRSRSGTTPSRRSCCS